MAGTVTGTIGNNAGVFFRYVGTAAAQHLDIGFQPSLIRAQTYSGSSPATMTWTWSYLSGYASVATINGPELGAIGTGAAIGTVTDVASVQGVQIGTSTMVNGSGYLYHLECWR